MSSLPPDPPVTSYEDEDPQDFDTQEPSFSPAGIGAGAGVLLVEKVYTPASSLRQPGKLIRELFADLGASRELAWRLFLRDVQAQYRKTFLGYLWIILPPLVSAFVWIFLRSQRLFRVDTPGVPYALFVLSGLILWEGFIASLNCPLNAIKSASSMLAKINFPREALLLAGLGTVLFNMGVRLLLLLGLFFCFQHPFPVTALLAPVGIFGVVGFGFTLGLLLVPLGVLYQDVARGIAAVTGIWFFLTPVVYPPQNAGPLGALCQFNPVSPVLVTAREMLLTGELTRLDGFLVVTGLSALGLAAGWVFFRATMPHLIPRMSSH